MKKLYIPCMIIGVVFLFPAMLLGMDTEVIIIKKISSVDGPIENMLPDLSQGHTYMQMLLGDNDVLSAMTTQQNSKLAKDLQSLILAQDETLVRFALKLSKTAPGRFSGAQDTLEMHTLRGEIEKIEGDSQQVPLQIRKLAKLSAKLFEKETPFFAITQDTKLARRVWTLERNLLVCIGDNILGKSNH